MSDNFVTTFLHAPRVPTYALGPSPKFQEGSVIRLIAPANIEQRAPEIAKKTPWGEWRVQNIIWERDVTGWVQHLYVVDPLTA